MKRAASRDTVTLLPLSCRAAGVKAGQSGKRVLEIASIPSWGSVVVVVIVDKCGMCGAVASVQSPCAAVA